MGIKQIRRRRSVSVVTKRTSVAGAGDQRGSRLPNEFQRRQANQLSSSRRPRCAIQPTLNIQQEPLDSALIKSNNCAALQMDDGTLSENPLVVIPMLRHPFGPDSPKFHLGYEKDLELVDGGGI